MRSLLPVISLLIILGCNRSGFQGIIIKDIDSIAQKWVPDTREGICTVSIKKSDKGKISAKGETNIPEAKAEIINYLARSGYEYADSIVVLPDPAFVKKPWGLVSISVCNIKKSPSHSSELVSQAIMGTPLKILKKKGGWLLIQTPDYYIGWVTGSGISELNSEEIDLWRKSKRVIFIRKSGDILSDSLKVPMVSDIVLGSIMVLKNEKDGKCEVVLPDRRRGVLNKSDVRDFKEWSATTFPEPEKLISYSELMLGSPYLWGGTSAKAFDCSGFVRTIYFTGATILARDASQQYLYGKPVEVTPGFSLLQKGDLIFFGNDNKGRRQITHVGMYIGDTEVIHCSGMVRINSLDSTRSNFSSYLKDSLMGVKRVIGTESGKGFEKLSSHTWYY